MQYACDFENILLNSKDGMGKPITWGNSAALEGYVRRLQQVAEQLKQKNRCPYLTGTLVTIEPFVRSFSSTCNEL